MKTETQTLVKLAIQNKKFNSCLKILFYNWFLLKSKLYKKRNEIYHKNNLTVDHPLIEARLLILDKQFNNTENLLSQNNLLDETIVNSK